jgi:hypothetical protein
MFGHFQNLNLLVLLHDLRGGRAAHGAWSSGTLLCPIAHGMPLGQVVGDLQFLGQAAEPERACDYAARHLGAEPAAVFRFVQLWDANEFSPGWLVRQLEDLWRERQDDADAVQELLSESPLTDAEERSTVASVNL